MEGFDAFRTLPVIALAEWMQLSVLTCRKIIILVTSSFLYCIERSQSDDHNIGDHVPSDPVDTIAEEEEEEETAAKAAPAVVS